MSFNKTTKVANATARNTINDLIARLSASHKSAEAMSEPGGYNGSTTHPSKNVDDKLQEGSEGARSAENVSDNKEDQPAGVANTTEGTPGGQDSVQLDVGVTTKATGEDPTNETEKAKGGKDDPGSSHPARTDNDSLDGSKYSSAMEEFEALQKRAKALGDDLMATIAVEMTKAANKPAQAPSSSNTTQVNKPAPKSAADRGSPEADTAAIDSMVRDSIADTIKYAYDMADKAAAYVTSFKLAEEDEKSEEKDEGGNPSKPANAAGGEDPAMLAALSGGAPEGGAVPGAEAAVAAMGGEGGGAPAPGPEAAGAGAGGGQEDILMLAQILAEAGISPDELAAAVQGGALGGGGAPGGAPAGVPGPEAGGAMPPVDGAPKVASHKTPVWAAKSASDLQKYARMKNHLKEVIGRNRR